MNYEYRYFQTNGTGHLSLDEIRRRLHLESTTEAFLMGLTPQQRNALCELRTRARMEHRFSGFPLVRVQDVPAWAADRW